MTAQVWYKFLLTLLEMASAFFGTSTENETRMNSRDSDTNLQRRSSPIEEISCDRYKSTRSSKKKCHTKKKEKEATSSSEYYQVVKAFHNDTPYTNGKQFEVERIVKGMVSTGDLFTEKLIHPAIDVYRSGKKTHSEDEIMKGKTRFITESTIRCILEDCQCIMSSDPTSESEPDGVVDLNETTDEALFLSSEAESFKMYCSERESGRCERERKIRRRFYTFSGLTADVESILSEIESLDLVTDTTKPQTCEPNQVGRNSLPGIKNTRIPRKRSQSTPDLPNKHETTKHYVVINRRKKAKCKKVHTETKPSLKSEKEDYDPETSTIVDKAYVITEEAPVKVAQPPENNRKNGRNHRSNHVIDPLDIEVDGRINDNAGDPPGQQSLYIPPGDSRKEAFRLSTFENYPSTTPVDIVNLAKHGFLYTGFYDRVKCFSCGRTVQAWGMGDNPSDKKWHKPDCTMALGQPSDNIPINGLLTSFLKRPARTGLPSQPMEVGTSQQVQNFNGLSNGFSYDQPERYGAAGASFTVAPGNTLVINNSGGVITTTSSTSLPGNSPSSNPRRQWRMANVISADHRRFLTNLYLNRELDRLSSFARWPNSRPNVSPIGCARAGFFYLGDMDRTQCFSCGGVLRNWSSEDDALAEHRTHFPSCDFVCGTEHRNVPIPTQLETQQDLANDYPMRYPSNPHMRTEPNRLATFDRRWPLNRTRAQPAEIAEAGFFFLGERDRVKCWYCNGGLQNWEYDDVPWIEHAKWFPNCQFLLKRQGQLFVYRHLSLNAHLPRPIIGRQDGANVDPITSSGEAPRSADIPPSAVARALAPSPPPIIIDPQEDMQTRRERVTKEIQSNDNVKNVVAMGFSEQIVRKVLEERLESGNPADDDNIFDGMASLLDAVMEKDNETNTEQEQGGQEQATGISFPSVSSNYSMVTMSTMETVPMSAASGAFQVSGFDSEDDDDLYSGSIVHGATAFNPTGQTNPKETSLNPLLDIPNDAESIKEIIEQKREERLCKICFTEVADMVFVPCSHMVCCRNCTEAIRQCPVCRKKIEKAIRTYVK